MAVLVELSSIGSSKSSSSLESTKSKEFSSPSPESTTSKESSSPSPESTTSKEFSSSIA